MNTLIFIFILFLCAGLVAWLLSTLSVPAPWGMLLRVALVGLVIFVLLWLLLGGVPVLQIAR